MSAIEGGRPGFISQLGQIKDMDDVRKLKNDTKSSIQHGLQNIMRKGSEGKTALGEKIEQNKKDQGVNGLSFKEGAKQIWNNSDLKKNWKGDENNTDTRKFGLGKNIDQYQKKWNDFHLLERFAKMKEG